MHQARCHSRYSSSASLMLRLQPAAAWGMQPQPRRRCALAVHAAVASGPSSSSSSHTPLSAGSLTKRITQAASTVELLQLHAAHRDSLDCIHYAALFNKLLQATDWAAQQASQHPGTAQSQQQQQRELYQQRQLYQQQRHPDAHRQQLAHALLTDLPHIIHTLQPGPLCVVMRVLGKLQLRSHPQLLLALLQHAQRRLGFSAFQPRELCTLAHALAELQPVHLPWAAPPAASAGQHQQQHADNSSSSGGSWDPVLLQDLFLSLGRSLQRCNTQDAAQALTAAARLQYTPSEAWLRVWLQRATQLLPRFTPQGLANASYGLVRALQARGDVPTISSNSSCDAGLGQHSAAPGTPGQSLAAQPAPVQQSQQQQQQQQQTPLAAAACAWLQSCLKVSVLHLGSLKPQELIGQLLWAAGKLSCSPPEPARHYLLAAAETMLPSCDARHLSAALYVFALLDHEPGPAAAATLWSCLTRQGSNLRPRDLDEVLWSAGKLQLAPPARARELLQQQALLLLGSAGSSSAVAGVDGAAGAQQGGVRRRGPRHAVGVLRGMVRLGWQLQDKYVVRFQGALLEQLEACVPQDYANTLWALASAGVKVEARWLDRVLMAASSSLEQFSPRELANTLWALAQLQHTPPKPWMQQLLLACLQQMGSFQPADFSQTLWGLAKLGFSPSPLWLNSFWSKCGLSMTRSHFSADELHALLLAAVKLEVRLPVKWVQAAAGAVERSMAGFGSQQLLEVLQALSQLTPADTAAAGAAAGVSSGSGASSSVQWANSIVPLSSSGSAGSSGDAWALQVQRLPGSSSSSSMGRATGRQLLSSFRHSPGVLRLYRQLSGTNRVVVAGQTLVRPFWPPHSSSLAVSTASTDGSSGSRGQVLLQQQQQAPVAPACADEAYSLACLVLLMPPQLRRRVEHWPQLLAADLASQQQQQQQQHLVLGR